MTEDLPSADDPALAHTNARIEAYRASYDWTDPDGTPRPLLPYSEGREALFWELVELDGGVDWDIIKGTPERPGNMNLFLPHAIKLLWLCSHSKEQIRPHRADRMAWIESIECWGNRHVPRPLHGDAINVAVRILNDEAATRAVPRPSDASSTRTDSGN